GDLHRLAPRPMLELAEIALEFHRRCPCHRRLGVISTEYSYNMDYLEKVKAEWAASALFPSKMKRPATK
ncbi:MAG TPA: hypothetical protein VN980_16690, partial [Alphaproteobacteria bacterium]|nr:hypothetical protein [Alphaproteobacteria bacterium]